MFFKNFEILLMKHMDYIVDIHILFPDIVGNPC